MAKRFVIDVVTDDITMPGVSGARRLTCERLIQFLKKCKSGNIAAPTVIRVLNNAVKASQTMTFTGVPTEAETCSIAATTFTAVANVATPSNNEFKVGTTAVDAAGNLAAAINASTTAAVNRAVQAGVRSVTITFTGAPTAADTVTINGVVLKAVANAATPGHNQFRIGTDAATAAANLVNCIHASTSAEVAKLTASRSTGAVTITTRRTDTLGAAITLTESLGNCTITNAILTLESFIAGKAQNLIACSDSLSNVATGAANLAGGDSDAVITLTVK